MPTLSERLVSWFLNLGIEDLPDDVVEATKYRILDTLGVMLVAAKTPIGSTVRDAVRAMGAGSDSRMIGYGDRTTAMGAALVNGTLAHAMDFDDTHNASLVHPGAPLVAAALAVGEMTGAGGEEVLVSVAGGVELCCRLGLVAQGHPLVDASRVLGVMEGPAELTGGQRVDGVLAGKQPAAR